MGAQQIVLSQVSSLDTPLIRNLFPDSYATSNNDQLSDEITLLAGQINAANYRFLKLIAEFDRREAWSGFGIRSCAHWLNWKCGISMGPAREKVRVARCLDTLPNINQAFAAGIISYSKVRAMTRVATNDNEEYLLMIAQHGTAQHIEQLVRKYQQVERCDNEQHEQGQQEARKVVCYQDDNGMWIIHAKLPAEAGALVVKAIDAVMETLQEKNVPAETFDGDKELVEEKAKGTEITFPQRRADALEALAEHYIATAGDSSGGDLTSLAGSERCQIMLHVDINTLKQQGCCSHADKGRGHHGATLEGHWISPQTAKRFACDASLVTVLEDENGHVLNIGRRSRVIPPAIKRALAVRDTTCRFPGCCETRYVDAHHIKHWADGGETSLDNLVTLCRFHHRELHKGSFQLKVIDTELVFTTLFGDNIEPCFTPQFPNRPMAEEQHWPLIDSHTGVSFWAGEFMDIDMAVDGLLQ